MIQAYIINFPGQYNKVCRTEKVLQSVNVPVTVHNYDPAFNPDGWQVRSSTIWATGQFLGAFDDFLRTDSEKFELMLFVLGDATSEQWEKIILRAFETYNKFYWGVYIPRTVYSAWTDNFITSDLYTADDPNLREVGCTDILAVFFNRQVLQIFMDNCAYAFRETKFGWGIDLCICAISYLYNMPVLQDSKYMVHHEKKTRYDARQAGLEFMQAFMRLDHSKITSYVTAVKTGRHEGLSLLKGTGL